MIPIDISRLDLPDGWIEKAIQLTEDLKKETTSKGRAKILKDNSGMWQSLKPVMERISNNKCWYCEAVNVRGDLHVDHYRPKSKVKNKDGSKSGGYWWLAFDHTNYRLACSYCNSLHRGVDGRSRGKSAQFPINNEANRATHINSNIDDELPYLLDPINPTDPALLWFSDDGNAIARTDLDQSCFLYKRVQVSIEILNLNEVKIKEARKKLWLDCQELIDRGDRAYEHYKNASISGTIEFKQVIKEIRRQIHESAQFSAMCIACFRGSGRLWVKTILQ